MPTLTHYTGSLDAVAGILTHGFLWYPNSRRLKELLLPTVPLRREPQSFGMVSFTELEPNETARHSERFGCFGIVVSESWAVQQRAQRVFYVPQDGPITKALQKIFAAGAADLAGRLPLPAEERFHMSYENRAMATAIGADLWKHLLTIWEYMEPEDSAPQREWRIVNPVPDYTHAGSKAEAIKAVSPPINWGKYTRVLPIGATEIAGFVCPASRKRELLSVVPPSCRHLPVHETGG